MMTLLHIIQALAGVVGFLLVILLNDLRKNMSGFNEGLKDVKDSINELNKNVAIVIERDAAKDDVISDIVMDFIVKLIFYKKKLK